jgi:predicted secreted hydrolase
MIGRAFLLILWLPVQVMAQGFAGLGTDAEGFAVPTPNPEFDFPQDHGAHPDYRIEWWYLTANLTGPDGTAYGVQWTLFRSALAPETREGWSDPQVWFAHAAVTTPDTHLVAERIARGGIGQAGVNVQPFEAWIDDWRMAGPSFDDLTLTARGDAFAYDLGLTANGPLIFHGDKGFSVKSAQGQASYYYSQPFYQVSGTLTLPQGDVPVTGAAWLDREWSSQPLADSQSGWDWFSLSFATGDKLMGFLLREDDGASFSSATWIAAGGITTSYADGAFAAQPLDWSKVSGRDVPTRWAVQLPDKGVDVTVTALNPNAWMALSIPYWEGPVTVEGSHTGRGYLEMTGYE